MKKIALITILIITVSCSENKKISNTSNYWSSDDLNELEYMVKIYDSVLTKAYSTSNEKEAYSNFLSSFSSSIKIKGSFIAPNGLDIKIKELQVFDKIWKVFPTEKPENRSINLYPSSRYFNYLKSISKNSDFLKRYIEDFENANDLTPSSINYFAKNNDEMDLSDLNYRLIVAVHYLTLMNR